MAQITITDTSGVNNVYPSLPVYQYQQSSIADAEAVAYLQSLTEFPLEAVKTAYTVARNESGNWQLGINETNFEGFQGDNSAWSSRWNNIIIGTTVMVDSTRATRRFLVFDTWQSGLYMLAWYMNDRGVYIGGDCTNWANINTVATTTDLYTAYLRAWVTGDITSTPAQSDIDDFTQLYKAATAVFG